MANCKGKGRAIMEDAPLLFPPAISFLSEPVFQSQQGGNERVLPGTQGGVSDIADLATFRCSQ